MSRPRALALALFAAARRARRRQAGTYHVYTCAAGGKVYPNGAWKTAPVAGVVVGRELRGQLDRADGPRRRADGERHVRGADVHEPGGHDDRGLRARPARSATTTRSSADTQSTSSSTRSAPTVFAGAGNYYDPTRNALNAQKQWYGYPDNNVAVAKSDGHAGELPRAGGLQGRREHARAARSAASSAERRARWAAGGAHQPHPARLAT